MRQRKTKTRVGSGDTEIHTHTHTHRQAEVCAGVAQCGAGMAKPQGRCELGPCAAPTDLNGDGAVDVNGATRMECGRRYSARLLEWTLRTANQKAVRPPESCVFFRQQEKPTDRER